MACYACRHPETDSVHENFYQGRSFRYIVHTGTGTQIVKCQQCGFMSVEFVHPKIAHAIFAYPPTKTGDASNLSRTNMHRQNCVNQLEMWQENIPKNCDRGLFIGAGRAELAESYCSQTKEMFACDLVPENSQVAQENPKLNVIEKNNLNAPSLEGTFDFLILSNVLERVAFPRSLLALCAKLLKNGGILMLEVPNMSYDLVRTSQYGAEEFNYFSPNSLHAMFATEGNFEIVRQLGAEEPMALKSSINAWSTEGDDTTVETRAVIRTVLQNSRNQVGNPQPDMEPQSIGAQLLNLSMACMIHSAQCARFSLFKSEPDQVVVPPENDHL